MAPTSMQLSGHGQLLGRSHHRQHRQRPAGQGRASRISSQRLCRSVRQVPPRGAASGSTSSATLTMAPSAVGDKGRMTHRPWQRGTPLLLLASAVLQLHGAKQQARRRSTAGCMGRAMGVAAMAQACSLRHLGIQALLLALRQPLSLAAVARGSSSSSRG